MREDVIIVVGLAGVATFFVGLFVCIATLSPVAAILPTVGAAMWFGAGVALRTSDDDMS